MISPGQPWRRLPTGLVVLAACVWLLAPALTTACATPGTPAPGTVEKASERIPRIGYLGLSGAAWPQGGTPRVHFFKQGLEESGYVDGQNIAVEYRFAEDDSDRLYELASELVNLPVEAIVLADVRAIRAALETTETVPLIMIVHSDPVGLGTIQSLSRPGGNITGLTTMSFEINGKRLQLFKQAAPSIRTVAVLWQRTRGSQLAWEELEQAAPVLGLHLRSYEIAQLGEIEGALAQASADGADALFVLVNPRLQTSIARISELAGQYGLPLAAPSPEFAHAGALFAYAPSYPHLYRRAAWYVDKILKGADPAELPVEQPSQFDLVVNLRAAESLGLTVPDSILAQATGVIR